MPLTEAEKELLSQPREPVNIRNVLDIASRRDPDRHAEVLDVARDTNMPAQVVETEMGELKRRQRVNSIDTSKFGPHLTKFLESADNAAVTLDDLDNLAATEKELERGSIAWQLQGIGESLQLIGGSLAVGVSDIGASIMDVVATVDDVVASVTTRPLARAGIIDRDYLGDDAARFRYRARRARDAATDLLIPEITGDVDSAISSGFRSVLPSMYGLLIGGATGNPSIGLGFMAGSSGSQAFSEAREQGLNVIESLAHGSTHGMVQFATERLPVFKMFEDFGVDASLLKKLGSQMATEVPGEQIATALQDLTDWANLPQNKDKPFSSYLEERPNAALQTLISTAVSTGTQTTAVHAIDRLVNGRPSEPGELKQARRMLASQNDQEQLDVLVELAQSSKTNQRAQDIYRDFLQGAGGDRVIYVPEDIISEYVNTPAPVQMGGEVQVIPPSILDQIDGTGTDVEIPIDVFMSEIATNENLMGVLRPHLKMGADLMSAADIEQGGDMEVKAALERAQAAADTKSELSGINERIYRQLKATGRQTEQEARAGATLVSARVKAASERYGLTPQQVMDRMNLTITGPSGGVITDEVDFQKPPVTASDLERLDVEPQPVQVDVDRRKDDTRRQRIADMSPEEQVQVIYKNELTGLNNRRAFDEDVADKEVVVSIDVDNLKAVNDNLGQGAGDNMLKAVADVMDQVASGNAYHISGDEFYLLGDSRAEVDEALQAIESALSESSIRSEKGLLKGLGISYGIAPSKDAADSAMKKSKAEREKAGQRVARGEKPAGMTLAEGGEVLEQAQPTISSTQDFGDLTLTEQVKVAGTGETVTMSQSAQRVFDQTVKRRDIVRKLKDCMNVS